MVQEGKKGGVKLVAVEGARGGAGAAGWLPMGVLSLRVYLRRARAAALCLASPRLTVRAFDVRARVFEP